MAAWMAGAPLAVWAGTPASATGSSGAYPKMTIGPGDLLDIQVYGENGGPLSTVESGDSALPVEYQVDSDGIIVYPFLGRVKLQG
ncbi:MAG: polysaccharide biosynthesis/export family protein, partial [bacterium]